MQKATKLKKRKTAEPQTNSSKATPSFTTEQKIIFLSGKLSEQIKYIAEQSEFFLTTMDTYYRDDRLTTKALIAASNTMNQIASMKCMIETNTANLIKSLMLDIFQLNKNLTPNKTVNINYLTVLLSQLDAFISEVYYNEDKVDTTITELNKLCLDFLQNILEVFKNYNIDTNILKNSADKIDNPDVKINISSWSEKKIIPIITEAIKVLKNKEANNKTNCESSKHTADAQYNTTINNPSNNPNNLLKQSSSTSNYKPENSSTKATIKRLKK